MPCQGKKVCWEDHLHPSVTIEQGGLAERPRGPMGPLNHSTMKNFHNSCSLLPSLKMTLPVNWPRICISRPPGTPFANSKKRIQGRLIFLAHLAPIRPSSSNDPQGFSDRVAWPKVDLAVDNVGGALLPQVVALLGYGGGISVVGRSGGAVPEFNTLTLFFRRIRLGGISVGDFTGEEAHVAWDHIVGRFDAVG